MKKILIFVLFLLPFIVNAQFNGFAFKPFSAAADTAPSWTPGTTANDGIFAVNTATNETWFYNGSWTEISLAATANLATPEGEIIFGNADSTGVASSSNLFWNTANDYLEVGGTGTQADPARVGINIPGAGKRIYFGDNGTGASPLATNVFIGEKYLDSDELMLHGKKNVIISTSAANPDDSTSARVATFEGVASFPYGANFGSVTFHKYPSNRNDHSTFAAVNHLYTDTNGKILSAPVDSAIVQNPVTGATSTMRQVFQDLKDSSSVDGNGIYTGDGTAPADVDVTITDSLEFGSTLLKLDATAGGAVGILGEPINGIGLRIGGATQSDGQLKSRGTGNSSATTASEVAFFNTTSSGNSSLLFNNSDELELYGNLGTVVQKWDATSTTFAGAVQVKIVKITAAGTTAISATDYYIRMDASLGAQTYTLPTATSGRVLKFKRLDNNAATVITFTGTVDGTVNPTSTGGGPIAGLATQYAALTLIGNGTDWEVAD